MRSADRIYIDGTNNKTNGKRGNIVLSMFDEKKKRKESSVDIFNW